MFDKDYENKEYDFIENALNLKTVGFTPDIPYQNFQ